MARQSFVHTRRNRAGPDRRPRSSWLPVLALLLAFPAALQAQGQILGQVVDAATMRPLGEVQVHLPSLGLGALTRTDGRFLILNVPVGTHSLVADRIGMRTSTQEVTVTAGGSTEVNFQLEAQALGLDELVVTGTAGAARRREVGTAVAQIDLANSPEPVISVDQALAARSPGMLSLRSSGMAGSGSQIRLRGNVSIAMSNQPLVYIDGIRIRSEGYALNHSVGQHVAFGPKDVAGPLNDINPNDIERIEVVKGPAATALYGTEAAGGVIQIFTKRGSAGAATWTAQMDQGLNYFEEWGPENAPYLHMNSFVRGTRDEILETDASTGYTRETGEFEGNFLSPVLNGAHQQRYALSVRGGASGMQYYLSGSLEDNQGMFLRTGEQKYLLRGNLGFQPLDNLDVQWNTTITRSQIQNMPSGSSPYSISHNAYKRRPSGVDANNDGRDDGAHSTYVGTADLNTILRLMDYDIDTDVNRLVTGLTATYTPMPQFTNRLTVGFDRIESDMRNIRPFAYVNDPLGSVSDIAWVAEQLTTDYVGTFDLRLNDDLRTSLSWGGQSVVSRETNLGASGRSLPGPGEHTVSSGATYTASESRLRVVNAGFFGQGLIDFRDRYFLTLALRIDGNSAFGENFGLQPYPRATFSWVASDESFWPVDLGELKFRVAWGHAGRAPGAFDAVRTWQPLPWLDKTAFDPRNVGNPELGPERTIELETGFDGSFFDERMRATFTYYNQETQDALIPVQVIPSTGFLPSGDFASATGGAQLRNVGTLSNTGIELDLSGTVIQNQTLSWDVGFTVYTNKSEAVDLGGAAGFGVSGGGWIQEGQPVPAVRYDYLSNPDEIADPNVVNDSIFGPNQPTLTLTPSTTFRFGNGVIVTARGEYQGGHFIYDRQSSSSAQRGQVSPLCDEAVAGGIRTDQSGFTAFERYLCSGLYSADLVYPSDFFRMRELTVQTPLPFQVPGASNATFTVALQNFWTWKNGDFLAMDPEMAGNEGMNSGITREIWEHPPPPASLRVSLRFTF